MASSLAMNLQCIFPSIIRREPPLTPLLQAHIHKRMYNNLDARGVEYEARHEYGSPGVLVGMSLTIKVCCFTFSIPVANSNA